jgi:hypothetical protein
MQCNRPGGEVVTCTLRLITASALALLAACGSGNGPGGDDDSVEILDATESVHDFGNYIIYFNAITTDQLDADIAGCPSSNKWDR